MNKTRFVNSKIKSITILVLITILLFSVHIPVKAQNEENITIPNYEDLLHYEWPQIHGDPGFTRFSAGPAPESSEILWKTKVEGIQSYITAFNGKVLVTTTKNIIALDKDSGLTLWNTTFPRN